MGFENMFKAFSSDGRKKTIKEAAVLGAAITAGAMASPGGLGQEAVVEMMQPEHGATAVKAEQQMPVHEQMALRQTGPHGETITMNEKGQPVVNIPASDMAPKPASIDLHEKTVDINLEKPVTTVDLHEPIYDAKLGPDGKIVSMTEEKAPE